MKFGTYRIMRKNLQQSPMLIFLKEISLHFVDASCFERVFLYSIVYFYCVKLFQWLLNEKLSS